MILGIELSYREADFDFNKVKLIYSNWVKFTPEFFTKKNKRVPWEKVTHEKIIEKYNNNDRISMIAKGSNLFLTDIAGIHKQFRSIHLNQPAELYFPTDEEIEKLFDDSMISTYIYNHEYTTIQSEVFETNLNGRGYSNELLDSIKSTPYKQGVHGREYDVKFNPGRLELGTYTWLMPAWKMWFGKSFFELIPKEKILSFPHATEIRELHSGVVFVQLYDDIYQPYSVENKFKQWKWREWVDYEHLIES